MATMAATESAIEINPDKVGGTPVIRGSRVAVSTLIGYLQDNLDLQEFCLDFQIEREGAQAVLDELYQCYEDAHR